jgi:hypothetical protein
MRVVACLLAVLLWVGAVHGLEKKRVSGVRPVARFALQIRQSRLPSQAYCVHALATTDGARWGLKWEHAPPRPAPGEVLLLLAAAQFECAFKIGSGTPQVARIERDGHDVVVHVGFAEPFEFEGIATLVPRPSGSGHLRVLLHGSIMSAPGSWDEVQELHLEIDPLLR